MRSQGWKASVVLAIVASATTITACGDRRPSPSTTSNYHGTWLRQSAFAAYADYKSGDFKGDKAHFCAAAAQTPMYHGLGNGRYRSSVQAFFVDPSGDVYRWSPTANFALKSSRRNCMGRINGSPGKFVVTRPMADVRTSWNQEFNMNSAWITESSWTRNDKHLVWYRYRDVDGVFRDVDFVAVHPNEMRDYFELVRGCNLGDFDYDDYQGMPGPVGPDSYFDAPPGTGPAPLPPEYSDLGYGPPSAPPYTQGAQDPRGGPIGPAPYPEEQPEYAPGYESQSKGHAPNKGKRVTPSRQGEVPPPYSK